MKFDNKLVEIYNLVHFIALFTVFYGLNCMFAEKKVI